MTSFFGRALAIAAFGGLALLAPRTGDAFCRTTTTPIPASYSPANGCFTDGLPLFWKGACVGYSVNENASALVPFDEATRVIDAAFATWNAATCTATSTGVGITASNLGAVTCGEVRYNQNGPNQNVVVFRDDKWPYSDPNNTLGLTTVTFNADTGEIYDADMEINASGKNLTTSTIVPANGFDLLSVVTHEAGHFLGLAHAIDSRATMYASYRPGTSALRTLTADDVAGLCEIYPSATTRNVAASVSPTGVTEATACDPAPRHGFASTCAENPPPADSAASSGGCAVARAPDGDGARWMPVVALAGAAVLARRRRARR
jgi:Matrixin